MVEREGPPNELIEAFDGMPPARGVRQGEALAHEVEGGKLLRGRSHAELEQMLASREQEESILPGAPPDGAQTNERWQALRDHRDGQQGLQLLEGRMAELRTAIESRLRT